MAMASRRAFHLLTSTRGISSTPHLASPSWFDKIKTAITEKIRTAVTGPDDSWSSFTLLTMADRMAMKRNARSFKEATIFAQDVKLSAVLRYLATIDPTGEKLKGSDKIKATEHCKCTIAEVEFALAKYTWMKEVHTRSRKLRAEGKPYPTTFDAMQKIMDKTPMEVLKSNLAKSDIISKTAPCPCGSRKRYKRCCGASKAP
uniref:Uncharacterized protein n=1 Tax=Avena sativa TaxID=4498 RepID=A0ACD5XFF1_AVESA